MAPAVTKCAKCRRPFAETYEFCPKCGALSASGKIATMIKIGSIGISVAALAGATFLVWRVAEADRDQHQSSRVAPSVAAPVETQK